MFTAFTASNDMVKVNVSILYVRFNYWYSLFQIFFIFKIKKPHSQEVTGYWANGMTIWVDRLANCWTIEHTALITDIVVGIVTDHENIVPRQNGKFEVVESTAMTIAIKRREEENDYKRKTKSSRISAVE